MGTIIPFPNQRLEERLEPLREFLDKAEVQQRGELMGPELDELGAALDHAWPGSVAIEQSWVTKLIFAWAGFAIGFGLYP